MTNQWSQTCSLSISALSIDSIREREDGHWWIEKIKELFISSRRRGLRICWGSFKKKLPRGLFYRCFQMRPRISKWECVLPSVRQSVWTAEFGPKWLNIGGKVKPWLNAWSLGCSRKKTCKIKLKKKNKNRRQPAKQPLNLALSLGFYLRLSHRTHLCSNDLVFFQSIHQCQLKSSK